MKNHIPVVVFGVLSVKEDAQDILNANTLVTAVIVSVVTITTLEDIVQQPNAVTVLYALIVQHLILIRKYFAIFAENRQLYVFFRKIL
jgi:hypothetical protein